MILFEDLQTIFKSPVRQIAAKVELFSNSTKTAEFTSADRLKEFKIERIGDDTKFSGFGVCQKINIKLIDRYRELNITTADAFKVCFKGYSDYYSLTPFFYVTEVHRDENTNELSITAYDALYKASTHTAAELPLDILNSENPYTLYDYARQSAALIGIYNMLLTCYTDNALFVKEWTNSANLDGTETIRDVLDAIAEATMSIYYIDFDNYLVFKRLASPMDADLEITKNDYFTLKSGDNRRLTTIAHITELGDNVSATTGESGTTQYLRNNIFLDLAEDVGAHLEALIASVGGLTINQFECSWRGNPLLEIGDKIALTTKDGNTVISYVLNDVITYNGGLEQETQWSYNNSDTETETNPGTLGEALKQTFARVDKANKEIELVAKETSNTNEAVSEILLTTDGITQSVSSLETKLEESVSGVREELETVSQRVDMAVTSEEVEIKIATEIANGVNKVETATGYVFNEEGLTVSKSDSEMETQITEDGMTVYKNDEAVLTANNAGVEALNLHATTYLIIGTNSRFEDYGERTGCFWIGG